MHLKLKPFIAIQFIDVRKVHVVVLCCWRKKWVGLRVFAKSCGYRLLMNFIALAWCWFSEITCLWFSIKTCLAMKLIFFQKPYSQNVLYTLAQCSKYQILKIQRLKSIFKSWRSKVFENTFVVHCTWRPMY